MKSLPTIDPYSYNGQMENNNTKMEGMMKILFPDLQVPYGYLYQIASYLEETKINAQILPKVIRGVANIIEGTGVGQVIVHVNSETVNVSTRETDGEIRSKF